MSNLEKLAVQMANTWHEIQRNTDLLCSDPEKISLLDQKFTQIKIEQLADLMDVQTAEIHELLKTI